MISITTTDQSVWNTATPVRLSFGHEWGLISRRLEEGDSYQRADELVGNRWRISQCTCNRCWSDVHTNRGNKVLLIKTPGIKMVGPFACRVVWQLEMGHIQKALRSAGLHSSRRTLFAARAAGTVSGASLAFFWVWVTKIMGPNTGLQNKKICEMLKWNGQHALQG